MPSVNMTPLSVQSEPPITVTNTCAYQSAFPTLQEALIIAPSPKYFVLSTPLSQRYREIYQRALESEQKLTKETKGKFSSIKPKELESELTRLIDDTMCLKRMSTLLHLPPKNLGAPGFESLERKTRSLQQQIRCIAIFMELHEIRDEKDPLHFQRALLGSLLRVRAHIPFLRSIKDPARIDITNKLVFENLLFVIRERFIGIKVDTKLDFIMGENPHLINLNELLQKLNNLISLVKDPRFVSSMTENMRRYKFATLKS